jgi:hypothetical protein
MSKVDLVIRLDDLTATAQALAPIIAGSGRVFDRAGPTRIVATGDERLPRAELLTCDGVVVEAHRLARPVVPHWRAWMKPENRCLVPVTSFCEPTDATDPVTGKKVWTWFAINDERPLFAFAGIWCAWHGTRGTRKAPEQGQHLLYGFLTTAANGLVAPIHAKAMPVILRTAEECDTWLTVDPAEALKMQRPLPDNALEIVATGEKEDPPPAPAPREDMLAATPELPL